MNKEVNTIKNIEDLLGFLRNLGKSSRNAWIFLHENVYKDLKKSENIKYSQIRRLRSRPEVVVKWKNQEYETYISFEIPNYNGWGKVRSIEDKNIDFGLVTDDPKEIFFLKMEE